MEALACALCNALPYPKSPSRSFHTALDEWNVLLLPAIARLVIYHSILCSDIKLNDKIKLNKVCMNVKSKRKRGAEPLLKYIKDLGGWPVLDDNWSESKFDWLQLAINSSSSGMGLIISLTVDQDPSVPEKYTIFLKQTTLGMANRDNYLKEENSKTLEAYRKCNLFMKLDWLTSWNSAADFIKIFRKNRILEIEIQKLSEQKPIGDFCRAPEMITPSTSTNQFFNMSKLSPHKIAPIFNKENFPRAKRKHVTGESKRVIGQLRHQA